MASPLPAFSTSFGFTPLAPADAIESDESSQNRIHNYFSLLTPLKLTKPLQIESCVVFAADFTYVGDIKLHRFFE